MILNASIKGRFKFETVSPEGIVRHPIGDIWVPNMVLNGGLDMILNGAAPANATGDWGFLALMAYCRLSYSETGSVSPTDQYMAVQAAATGSYVKSHPSGTTAINSVSYSQDASYVSATFQRTFVLAPQGTSYNWNGVGISNSAANLDPLFSKVILGGTVTVGALEELRIIYQLSIKLPLAAAAVTINNGGFTGDGTIRPVGTLAALFGGINANGTATGASATDIAPIIRGRRAPVAYLLQNATYPAIDSALSPTYSGVNLADSQSSASYDWGYTPGTYQRDWNLSWVAGRPAATVNNVRSILFANATTTAGIQWLLAANQTKDTTLSLIPQIRVAWTRA